MDKLVCLVFGLIKFCVTQSCLIIFFLKVIELILFYPFFLFVSVVVSFQDLFRSFLVLFVCSVLVLLILMLGLGLTYFYSYRLTYSYCYLGVKEERYCVSYHKVRICSFIRH